MGKTIKICLAMGGGVSLGTFSGASLTEAIKLIILFGKDKDGKEYDKIIVDGMSGASAGAIALTIMLKTLMDYKNMMQIYNDYIKDIDASLVVNENSLLDEIALDYFNNDAAKVPSKNGKKEQLIAIQLAQKVQEQIWVERLNSDELFGDKIKKKPKLSPHSSFSLLDRGLLEKLAKAYILNNKKFNLSNRKILDKDRVIFACSLTNLLPMEIGFKQEKKPSRLQENVVKSTGSQNHTELRVIDFIFNKKNVDHNKPSDSKWFKLYANAPDQKMELDINNKKAWSVVTATALACGAFPIAFEPVVLRRYKEEYSKEVWPQAFKDIQTEIKDIEKLRQKSFFNETGDNYIDYNSFNFPYIDGGTFNNEPIREAFRIASFQDFGKESENFDRLILFVDPAVREDKYHSFNIKSFASIVSKDFKNKFNTETSKLINNITATVGVLANQGSIKEEHRIKDVQENLNLRKELFSYINSNRLIYKNLKTSLIKTTFDKIDKNLKQGLIPIGTRDYLTFFQNELIKNCKEQNYAAIILDRDALETIKEMSKNNVKIDAIFDLLNTGIEDKKIILNRKVLFAQTVFRLMTDFSLKTVGKNDKAEYMSVLPIAPDILYTIKLPGSEVEAFAGFASLESRTYAFKYGRLSTLLSLQEQQPNKKEETKEEPPVQKGFRAIDEIPIIEHPSLSALEAKITRQLLELPFYKENYKFTKDLNNKLYKLGIDRLIMLFLPNKILRFAVSKIPTLITGGLLSIVTLLSPLVAFGIRSVGSVKYGLKSKTKHAANEINYKKLIPITISILSSKKTSKKIKLVFKDKTYGEQQIRMKEYKKEDGSYQYLFQLHYLEYLKYKSNEEKPESIGIFKTDSNLVQKVGLTSVSKIPNPSIDSNLNFTKWRSEIEQESEKIEIESISFMKGPELGNIIKDINNKKFSLHYSLKNINYHVNPILEYNIDDAEGNKENSWYFKENTKAFFMDLM